MATLATTTTSAVGGGGAGAFARRTERIVLPQSGIGTQHSVLFHHYGPPDAPASCYIQASLHADELPGLIVTHHLIKLLDEAAKKGQIKQRITLCPFANPIGLSQVLLGTHIGRFSFDTGINFNRDFLDVTDKVAERVESLLVQDDAEHNVKVIRQVLAEEIQAVPTRKEETVLKKILLGKSAVSDIVLDLHCDTDAVLHMYTHTQLWPKLADLAAEIHSHCQLTASTSGGNPFDEVNSCPWAALQAKFPTFAIPMACESATIELRGESDVYDHYAIEDANALFRFLQRRGFVQCDEATSSSSSSSSSTAAAAAAPGSLPPLPALIREATPLTGVDMVEATVAGVVAWKVKVGDFVEAGQVLGEIVDIEDPDKPRTPVTTSTAGLVFGVRRHKLVRPGQIIIKVSGEQPLEHRKGNLLTS